MAVKTERGGRVFPASDKASDVTAALKRFAERGGAEIRLNTPVRSISVCGGGFDVNGEHFDAVIIATGGLSYPSTGSTGDGYEFARRLGHSVTDCFPALVPLDAREGFAGELEGLSLKNVELKAYAADKPKPVFHERGEMLFTNTGISGPLVLGASRHFAGVKCERRIIIDLKPALGSEELEARLLRDFSKFQNQNLSNAMCELLPKRMIGVIIASAGLDVTKKVNTVTRAERAALVRAMKNVELTVTGDGGFSEAVITAGGVSVKEICPKTMESRLCRGLFFAGEIIDVDACTGGFNMQIAFCTGYAAGKGAASI
jgi:hypothetical protein